MALNDDTAKDTPSNITYVIRYHLFQVMVHILSSTICLDLLFTHSRISGMTGVISTI
jgi:hypothetical protein